jgi:hypothetical protein
VVAGLNNTGPLRQAGSFRTPNPSIATLLPGPLGRDGAEAVVASISPRDGHLFLSRTGGSLCSWQWWSCLPRWR